MSKSWHPDESQLLSYTDSELASEDNASIGRHVEECDECRQRLAEFRNVFAIANQAVQAHLPPPPEPWANLRPRLNKLDVGRVQSRRSLFPRVDYRWIAVAAALVIGIVAIRLTSEQTVSAAELLENATVQEARAERPKRIRVKTRRAEWVRAASAGDNSEVASMFRAANYNWDEPLSTRSFSNWRSSLPAKDDRVKILSSSEFGRGRYYRITTSTPQGALAEASITLRAEDLRAVHESFQFRNNELIEITEDMETTPSISAEQRLAQARPEQPREARPPATAAQELQVVAALHAIGADLGEPVEITRKEGSARIDVTALVTDPERQQQIRTALSGLPFVELQFDQPDAVRTTTRMEAGSTETAVPSSPLQDGLSAKLGGRVPLENFTNHVMDLGESALARAHALRSLAQRFPPEVEAQLSPQERQSLQAIQTAHISRLMSSVRTISEAIRPVAAAPLAEGMVEAPNWHTVTNAVLESARRFDRIATETLAGKPSAQTADEALRGLARAASELQFRAEALQKTVARGK